MNTAQRFIVSSGRPRVRVTFKAGTSGGLTLDHASIGVQSTTYNTQTTPMELRFSGASGFAIAATATITSDWAVLPSGRAPRGASYSLAIGTSDDGWGAYSVRTLATLSSGLPLIVAMDINNTAAMCFATAAGQCWYQSAFASYAAASPSGSFTSYAFGLGILTVEVR